jgi:hypothetical protein
MTTGGEWYILKDLEMAEDWLPGGTKENHKMPGRTAGISGKVWTIPLPNTSLECCHLHQQDKCPVVLMN